MTTDSFSGKSEGKGHLTNAIGGLIFLIGGYLIFLQINPNILNINFNTADGRVEIIAGQVDISLLSQSGSELDNPDDYDAFKGAWDKKFLGDTEEICTDQYQFSTDAANFFTTTTAGASAGIGWLLGKFVGQSTAGAVIFGSAGYDMTASIREVASSPGFRDDCELLRDALVEQGAKTSPCKAREDGLTGLTQSYCFIGKSLKNRADCGQVLHDDGYDCTIPALTSCGNKENCDNVIDKILVSGNYVNANPSSVAGVSKVCEVSGGNDYACIQAVAVDKNTHKLLGGDLCYDASSCLKKLKVAGFEGCSPVKMVFAEKCGNLDIGCTTGTWKYNLYIPKTCEKK